jgi:1-deoxyxylulose-5-phosphate synthase
MERRFLGRAGLPVSVLSLGTAALGMAYGIHAGEDRSAGEPPPDEAEALALLQKAVNAGINFIDTARAYGNSETLIGRALHTRRDVVFVATKVHCLDQSGTPLTGQALQTQVRESLHRSLQALRTDHVDLLMVHSAPPALLERDEIYRVLETARSQGYSRLTGASTYGLAAPRLAIEGGLDTIQLAYNVLDRRAEEEILPLAHSRGTGVVVRSVYLKGALTERGEDLPAHLDDLRQLSRRFRNIAASYHLEPAEVALRFALSHDAITTVLVGVRSEVELQTALAAAAKGKLPSEILADLETLRTDNPLLIDPSRWGLP